MSPPEAILAIDQGTTSSRAIVFDSQTRIVATDQEEFPQRFPQPGWVEHAPSDLWDTTLRVARTAFEEAESNGYRVVAIGLTNQRETSLVWDRASGEPIYPAIVWQDRRTAEVCARLRADGVENEVQGRTGLLLDPYFSATKTAWILDHVDGARNRAKAGELAFGTVDSFLIYRLTGGRSHVTDATNASRTSLYNLRTADWDDDLLRIFDLPHAILPCVLDCAASFGETEASLFGRSLPILGVAGDQQAAAIGQCCFQPGQTKSTYGTGCFVLTNTGETIVTSQNRLLTTLAYRMNGVSTYAVEGSVFIAGAALQWLRDSLGFLETTAESEAIAATVRGDQGLYLVPAFTGLGAPYWDPEARGALLGITRSTGPAEIVRAAIESVAYQTHDLFAAMTGDGGAPTRFRVDGGMAQNDLFVQFLGDILDLPIDRPKVLETTALGAAYLAGLTAGIYGGFEEIAKGWRRDTEFVPQMDESERRRRLDGWKVAVSRVLS